MSKFIRIKNHLINVDKVCGFELCDHCIFVSYTPGEAELCIEFNNKHHASNVFADIPHLIDNSIIPDWVRESNDGAVCRPEYFNMDFSYDELPF